MATKRYVGTGPTVDNQSTPSQIVYNIPLDPATGGTADATNGVKSSVTSVVSSTVIAASNPNRKKLIIANASTQILYLDLTGGAASSTQFSMVLPASSGGIPGYYSIDGFTGAVTGVWPAANGFASVTELV